MDVCLQALAPSQCLHKHLLISTQPSLYDAVEF